MELIFFLLFIVALYSSFYLPGKLLLSRVFPKLSLTHSSLLAWPVGIALFLFLSYVGGWIHIQYLPIASIAAVITFIVIRDRSMTLIKIGKGDWWSWILILSGSILFLCLSAFSYIYTNSGIQFIGIINVIDGLLHIGYTKDLLTNFPPTHAGLSQIPLRGYHYFYDLLLSRFVLFYHLRPEELYYRDMPFFISMLYGIGFWLIGSTLTKDKAAQRWILFFAYFAQSFGFLLSFFIPSISPIAELGNIYPLELILNPAIILSIGMLLSFTFLLFESKPKFPQMMLVGFLFGMITELKVYTGIIGISVLGFICLSRIIKNRQDVAPYLIGLSTCAFVIAVTYIPNNFGAGNLWFSPFFAYSVFMQEPPFTSWNWEFQRIIFRDHHNIPHLVVLYAQAIGLFWILSLGSRIAVVLGLRSLLRVSFWRNERNRAIIVMIVVPIVIGSLFVQSISIFDTKQFFWIAGALIAIPAGIALGNFLSKTHKGIQISLGVLIIFLSFGGVYGQLQAFLVRPGISVISNADVVLLQSIGRIVPSQNFILYINEPSAHDAIGKEPFSRSPVIAVLTGRSTYFEPESAQFDLAKIYRERQTNITIFEKLIATDCNSTKIKNMLNEIGTPYVIISEKDICLEKMASKKMTSETGLSFYTIPL